MNRRRNSLKTSLFALAGLGVFGSAQAQIPDFAAMGEETPYGITHDGANLWISDYDADKLFKLDANGEVIQTLNIPFTFPRGMAYHDGNLIVTTGSVVRRVDPATGVARRRRAGRGRRAGQPAQRLRRIPGYRRRFPVLRNGSPGLRDGRSGRQRRRTTGPG